nr:MAG TPA: hypothetical protein [Caudoviricetes sp.]
MQHFPWMRMLYYPLSHRSIVHTKQNFRRILVMQHPYTSR